MSASGLPTIDPLSSDKNPFGVSQELTAAVGGKAVIDSYHTRRTVNQRTDQFVSDLTYFTAAWLPGTTPSFGSITPRFLTTLKMPLLAWAMYMFNRA